MKFNYNVLDETEKIIFSLRSIYNDAGYKRYKMGKFEEYDLYSRNKEFLVSDGVITFMDSSGKLMALKPDVTLSIIKNNKDPEESVTKLYYNENVYRVSKNTGTFKEIMQTGLECFGKVDARCISEVLMLAGESLKCLKRRFVLEISDLDILSYFVNEISASQEIKEAILKCAGEKNTHGIISICRENSIPEEKAGGLIKLLSMYGSAEKVLPELKELCDENGLCDEYGKLEEALAGLEAKYSGDEIEIDFSSVGDMNYYNGMIFRGFIEGVPESVLSGGQYDKLMEKLGRKSSAIGFAVYLDMLERIDISEG